MINTKPVYTVIRYAPDDCMVLGIYEDPVVAMRVLTQEVNAKRVSAGSIERSAYFHADVFDLIRVSFSDQIHIALREERMVLKVDT